jgi:hypothetical protein
MVPCLLPLIAVLGAMGWMGAKIDLGVAMTAGVALGLAAEGVFHFVNWYRRGLGMGHDRWGAVAYAYDNCGVAMVESGLIAGAGLAVFSLSAFTPLREVGHLSVAMITASLVGVLLILPAILTTRLGWFFAPLAMRKLDPLWPRIQERWALLRSKRRKSEPEVIPIPAPHIAELPRGPHYGDDPAAAPAKRTPLTIGPDQRRELADGPHAALHAKLQGMRRPRSGDSPTT